MGRVAPQLGHVGLMGIQAQVWLCGAPVRTVAAARGALVKASVVSLQA